jgi:thymidylate synthase (FAD)
MLLYGATPQVARAVLPTSTAASIVVTANLREWRHLLKLRTDKAAHPQMREVMVPLLEELKNKMPIIFGDITY